MKIFYFILICLLSYFFGNISNARIISKALKKDITEQGSGNPGTMNMLRTFGFKTGLLTLTLDVIKGVIPALAGLLIFKHVDDSLAYAALYAAGLSVVVGHNFPIFYKFKGGKGVACILGVYAVAQPLWALVAFAGCFLYLLIFDYGAVASFIFITTLTVIEVIRFEGNLAVEIMISFMFFLTWFMHRKNIERMLTGKERKAKLLHSIRKMQKKNYRQNRKDYKKREIG